MKWWFSMHAILIASSLNSCFARSTLWTKHRQGILSPAWISWRICIQRHGEFDRGAKWWITASVLPCSDPTNTNFCVMSGAAAFLYPTTILTGYFIGWMFAERLDYYRIGLLRNDLARISTPWGIVAENRVRWICFRMNDASTVDQVMTSRPNLWVITGIQDLVNLLYETEQEIFITRLLLRSFNRHNTDPFPFKTTNFKSCTLCV